MKKNLLQEEINKNKVLMGYNSKKTLTENQNALLDSNGIFVAILFPTWSVYPTYQGLACTFSNRFNFVQRI